MTEGRGLRFTDVIALYFRCRRVRFGSELDDECAANDLGVPCPIGGRVHRHSLEETTVDMSEFG